MAERDVKVLHCPGSNLKLGSGLAPVVEMRAKGISVSLGADGAACNNHLDMFEEMRLAAVLQSVRHQPGALTARDAVQMATREGARALGLEHEIGSIEVGKRADLILIDATGTLIPYSTIVYASRGTDVRTTIVDGEVLVDDFRPTRWDPAEISRGPGRGHGPGRRATGSDVGPPSGGSTANLFSAALVYYVVARHIVPRHMTTIKRDPAPYLPLTPAAFHVLLALADGAKHGYLILKDVEERTGGEVRLSTGTLYGLIKRFLDDELIVETAARRRRPRAAAALQADAVRPPGGARRSGAPRTTGVGRARRAASSGARVATWPHRVYRAAAADAAARIPRGVRPRNDAGVRRQPRVAARRTSAGVDRCSALARCALDQLRVDLRHAIRGLLRQKTFTLTAVTTLALALGPATAVFSLINGVLLDPLPQARDLDRVVYAWAANPGAQPPRISVERAELPRSSRAQAGALAPSAAIVATSATIGGDGAAAGRTARGSRRTCSTCSASRRARGRRFTAADMQPGARADDHPRSRFRADRASPAAIRSARR